MLSSVGATLPSSPLRLTLRGNRITLRGLLISIFFGLIIALSPIIIASSSHTPRRLLQTEQRPDCVSKVKFDVAFLVDQSGSFAKRGQSYNIELEGIIRAVRNQTIIPRDGSVSLAVLTFNGSSALSIPIKTINSDCDAETFATDVEKLKCANIGDRQTAPCPFGDTNYTDVINKADRHLRQTSGPGTRRVLLMSSDGEPTDPDKRFIDTAKQVSANAIRDGIVMEFDVILLGLEPNSVEFMKNKANVDEIVFPKPSDDLPGAVLVINGSDCNKPGANMNANDCNQQADEFAADVRKILRSPVPQINLIVNTDEDPLEVAVSEIETGRLSLRQAIELANCRQGGVTITFADNLQDKTIRLNAPLPPLTAPDIKIDGCRGVNCVASITIDGSKFRDQPLGENQSDGILIRSNNDEVRGLRVVNFRRAGVAVAPVLQTDGVGHNRIVSNTIERTGKAGILIIDYARQGQFSSCLVSVAVHNVGNTISQNTILQESPLPTETPRELALIDLGGDGPTPNDDGDADEGPNRLLNFPENLTIEAEASGNTPNSNNPNDVVAAASTVRIKGQAAAVANATVEIFGVTKLNTKNCSLAIEGVIFLAKTTTAANGSFDVGQVPASPTGVFIATLTDAEGNTSELTSDCLSFKRVEVALEGNGSMIEFKPVGVKIQKKAKQPQSRAFTIQNVGCSPLTLTLKVKRKDDRICQNRGENCLNDTAFFSVVRVVNDGQQGREEPVFSADGTPIPITIQRGRCQDFRVRFNPVVPVVTKVGDGGGKLSAKDVLPDKVTSEIIIESSNLVAEPIKLVGQVKPSFQLISCDPEKTPAVVTLDRFGDDLIVALFVYDSNRNVDTARFEFFDANKTLVKVDKTDVNLRAVIDTIKPVPGQSFAVIQRFSNAGQHPEVRSVRVTVFDANKKSDVVKSNSSVVPVCVAEFRDLQGVSVMVLPKLKLSTSHGRRESSPRRITKPHERSM